MKRHHFELLSAIDFNFPNGGIIKLVREKDKEREEEVAAAFAAYYKGRGERFTIFKTAEMKAVHTDASHTIFVISRTGRLGGTYSYVNGKIEPGDGIPEEYYGENSPLLKKSH
jgi:hypothetical protein